MAIIPNLTMAYLHLADASSSSVGPQDQIQMCTTTITAKITIAAMNSPLIVFQKLSVSIAYSAVKLTVARALVAMPVLERSL